MKKLLQSLMSLVIITNASSIVLACQTKKNIPGAVYDLNGKQINNKPIDKDLLLKNNSDVLSHLNNTALNLYNDQINPLVGRLRNKLFAVKRIKDTDKTKTEKLIVDLNKTRWMQASTASIQQYNYNIADWYKTFNSIITPGQGTWDTKFNNLINNQWTEPSTHNPKFDISQLWTNNAQVTPETKSKFESWIKLLYGYFNNKLGISNTAHLFTSIGTMPKTQNPPYIAAVSIGYQKNTTDETKGRIIQQLLLNKTNTNSNFLNLSTLKSNWISGWFASNTWLSVLTHEIGHAFESFLATKPAYLNRFNQYGDSFNFNDAFVPYKNKSSAKLVDYLDKRGELNNSTSMLTKKLYAYSMVNSWYGRVSFYTPSTSNEPDLFAEAFSEWLLSPFQQDNSIKLKIVNGAPEIYKNAGLNIGWQLLNDFFTKALWD